MIFWTSYPYEKRCKLFVAFSNDSINIVRWLIFLQKHAPNLILSTVKYVPWLKYDIAFKYVWLELKISLRLSDLQTEFK